MSCFSPSRRSRSRGSTLTSAQFPREFLVAARAVPGIIQTMSSTVDLVTVTARGAARLRGGNPWVYAEDVAKADARGDVVRVVDGRGALLGTALWAAGARLPLRLISRAEVTFDAELINRLISSAL